MQPSQKLTLNQVSSSLQNPAICQPFLETENVLLEAGNEIEANWHLSAFKVQVERHLCGEAVIFGRKSGLQIASIFQSMV